MIFNLYFCVVEDSQPPKELGGDRGSEAVPSQGSEAGERANSEEKDKVEDSATSQSDEAKDVEKEKESATSPRYIEI